MELEPGVAFESLPSVIARQSRERPDDPAIYEVDGEVLSYGALHRRSLEMARRVRELGVRDGDVVVTVIDNSLDAYPVWLGISYAGAVEAPVDPRLTGLLLRELLENLGTSLVLCHARFLAMFDTLDEPIDGLRVIAVDTPDGLLATAAPAPGAEADPEPPAVSDLACIIHTSGTTGRPKAVQVPWGLLAASRTNWSDLGRDDIYYNPHTMFHKAGRCPLAWVAPAGGAIVVRRDFRTQEFLPDINRYRCTAAGLFPFMAEWLLALPEQPDDHTCSLRLAVVSPMISRPAEFARRFGVRLRTVFGSTEVGVPLRSADRDIQEPVASCGELVPWIDARIADEFDHELPDGQVGQLLLRPNVPWTLNVGYYGMPDRTVAAWRNGWFHTGDAFRRDSDGRFYFVDRVDDYLRRKGENVSSYDVERLILQHPGVVEAAAVGLDSDYGDLIVVHLLLRSDGTVDGAEVARHCREVMPKFMRPDYLVVAEEFPRTAATLKVRKSDLRDLGLPAGAVAVEQTEVRS